MYLNYSFISIIADRCVLQTSYLLVTLVPQILCSIMSNDYINLSGKKLIDPRHLSCRVSITRSVVLFIFTNQKYRKMNVVNVVIIT